MTHPAPPPAPRTSRLRVSPLEALAIIACAVSGAIVWAAIKQTSGATDAWDDPSYWSVGLPIMAATTLLAGLAAPRWFLLLGLAVVIPQAAILLRTGAANLLPFTLFFFAAIALICTMPAAAARGVRTAIDRIRATAARQD